MTATDLIARLPQHLHSRMAHVIELIEQSPGVMEFQQSYSTIRNGYAIALVGSVQEYLNGGSKARSRARFIRAVSDYLPRAFDAGREEGATIIARGRERRDKSAESRWIKRKVEDERRYAGEFWDRIDRANNPHSPATLVEGYMRTLDSVFVYGRLFAAPNARYKFVRLMPTADACRTCLRLENKVRPAKYWLDQGLVPAPGANLECAGYRCGHSLQRVIEGNEAIGLSAV